MGRKAFAATEAQRLAVKIMRAGGMSVDLIALSLGLDHKTVEKYFRAELAAGKAQIDAKVIGTLAKMAMSGDCPSATFFWLKTRCNWRETANIAVEPVEITHHVSGDPVQMLISRINQLTPAEPEK